MFCAEERERDRDNLLIRICVLHASIDVASLLLEIVYFGKWIRSYNTPMLPMIRWVAKLFLIDVVNVKMNIINIARIRRMTIPESECFAGFIDS